MAWKSRNNTSHLPWPQTLPTRPHSASFLFAIMLSKSPHCRRVSRCFAPAPRYQRTWIWRRADVNTAMPDCRAQEIAAVECRYGSINWHDVVIEEMFDVDVLVTLNLGHVWDGSGSWTRDRDRADRMIWIWYGMNFNAWNFIFKIWLMYMLMFFDCTNPDLDEDFRDR